MDKKRNFAIAVSCFAILTTTFVSLDSFARLSDNMNMIYLEDFLREDIIGEALEQVDAWSEEADNEIPHYIYNTEESTGVFHWIGSASASLEEEAEILLATLILPGLERHQQRAIDNNGFGYIQYVYRATWVHSTTLLHYNDYMAIQPVEYIEAPHTRVRVPLTMFQRSQIEPGITHVFKLTFTP